MWILLQMFAFGLNSLFELLEVSEDCYGVGYLSKVIATELANLPAARMRRKVSQPSYIIWTASITKLWLINMLAVYTRSLSLSVDCNLQLQ